MFLTLKIMDFENVDLTKIVHIYVIEDMNEWYTWYKSVCNKNLVIFNMKC